MSTDGWLREEDDEERELDGMRRESEYQGNLVQVKDKDYEEKENEQEWRKGNICKKRNANHDSYKYIKLLLFPLF